MAPTGLTDVKILKYTHLVLCLGVIRIIDDYHKVRKEFQMHVDNRQSWTTDVPLDGVCRSMRKIGACLPLKTVVTGRP